MENCQLPPQNDQNFHATLYAHICRPRPRWPLYAKSCSSLCSRPRICSSRRESTTTICRSVAADASGLDVNVSGYEAEGGRGEPVSCEGDTENKDEALDVKRKATMDGWTLGLSMHVIRSCSLCRRKTCTSFSTPSFIFPTFFVSVSLCHLSASSSLLPPSFLFHSLEVIYEYGVGARMSCVLYWDNTEI